MPLAQPCFAGVR